MNEQLSYAISEEFGVLQGYTTLSHHAITCCMGLRFVYNKHLSGHSFVLSARGRSQNVSEGCYSSELFGCLRGLSPAKDFCKAVFIGRLSVGARTSKLRLPYFQQEQLRIPDGGPWQYGAL